MIPRENFPPYYNKQIVIQIRTTKVSLNSLKQRILTGRLFDMQNLTSGFSHCFPMFGESVYSKTPLFTSRCIEGSDSWGDLFKTDHHVSVLHSHSEGHLAGN